MTNETELAEEPPLRRYKLLGPDGHVIESDEPGTIGGNSRDRIYGRLDCPSAIRALPAYAAIRVFFADEDAAIRAGYRPCGNCMKARYAVWRAGGEPGSLEYPWLKLPANA
jgi:hypothetical protein